MLNLFLCLFYVKSNLGASEVGKIEVSGNSLLIYTDIGLEKLKIGYKEMNSVDEYPIALSNATSNEESENFPPNTHLYSITLPDVSEGSIIFELQGDDEAQSKKLESIFKKTEKGDSLLYVLTHPKRRILDEDSFVFEANYTFINIGLKDNVVCVISEDLNRKIQLDKSLDLYHIKKASLLKNSCDVFLIATFENLKNVRSNKEFFDEHLNDMRNFICGFVFEAVTLYSIITVFECIYNSQLYESYIFRQSEGRRLVYMFLRSLNIFKNSREYNYEKGFEIFLNVYEEKYGSKLSNEIGIVKSKIQSLSKKARKIKIFYKKKGKFENEYVQKRNEKFLEVNKIKNDDGLNSQIIKLRNNQNALSNATIIRCYIRIIKFLNDYVNKVLTDDKKNEFISSNLKDIEEELKYCYKTKANIAGLFTDQFEICFDNLSKDSKFRELTPENIINLIEESKKQIDECRNLCGTSDLFFRDSSKSFIDQFIDLEKTWKEIRDNNVDVGLFSQLSAVNNKCTNDSDEKGKKESKKDGGRKLKWAIMITFFAILILILGIAIVSKNHD